MEKPGCSPWSHEESDMTEHYHYYYFIYKELTQLNSKRANNPTLKGTEDLNIYFFKRRQQMANKYTKKVLKITTHQENTHQNYNEVSPQTC